jgi:hypothetical protein
MQVVRQLGFNAMILCKIFARKIPRKILAFLNAFWEEKMIATLFFEKNVNFNPENGVSESN